MTGHRRLGKPRQQPGQERPKRYEVVAYVDAAVDCLTKHAHTEAQVATGPGLLLHGKQKAIVRLDALEAGFHATKRRDTRLQIVAQWRDEPQFPAKQLGRESRAGSQERA